MTKRMTRRTGCLFLFIAAGFLLPTNAWAGKKVLRLLFDGPVLEAPDENAQIFGQLFGGPQANTLYDWIRTIDRAAKDPEIAGIAMIVESPQVGMAQIEELSRSLKAFREKGKKIYCYMDYAGNGSYALACAADHITLTDYSDLGIAGLNAELSYYKGLLDKIGVQADMLHCGAYKSALEPYTRTEPSPEAAENINWLLDGIYERWVEMMAEGRGLTVDQVKAFVDKAPLEAVDAKEGKLIDEVGSFADFRQMIRKEFGQDAEIVKKLEDGDGIKLDFENPFAIFQMLSELMEKQNEPHKPGIALIYIDGGISMGKSDNSPFGGSSVGSTTIRAAFQQAYEDPSVKAIVVRVNSPGGSALASDIMWKMETKCAAEKPLVVSQGNVAGSGGYYVSIPGDVIFAEESTITASIGVVGGKFVWKDLMESKLGITTTEFKRGAHADLMTMNRLWTEEERDVMMKYMDQVYKQFKDRIMTSRGDRLKKNLEDMAGGRVYTGKQALELGLVDRIGGLSDAIKYAVEKAGLTDYEVYIYPEAEDFADILAKMMNEDTKDEWEISMGGRLGMDPILRTALPVMAEIAPDRVRDMYQALQTMLTIQNEHVGCFMPFELRIR